MLQAVSNLRNLSTLIPVNRETAMYAGALLVALSVGGILADAVLNGMATPAIR